MAKRKVKKPAPPRKKLNFKPVQEKQTDPAKWGPPDQMPGPGFVQPEGDTCYVGVRFKRGPQFGYFVHLVNQGDITREQFEAGKEIAHCFEAIVSQVMSRTQSHERVDRSPDNDWPEALRIAMATRYAPWRDVMKEWHGRGKPSLSIVIDAVVECRSVNEMKPLYRMGHETIKKLLIEALQEYCIIAGWQRRPVKMRATG